MRVADVVNVVDFIINLVGFVVARFLMIIVSLIRELSSLIDR